MSIITVLSRNEARHADLMDRLKRIEISHIQKELQAREQKDFFSRPKRPYNEFERSASGKSLRTISFDDATLCYNAEQQRAPSRDEKIVHPDFGIIYRQSMVCRMSVYAAVEHFNRVNKPEFVWLRGEHSATLFSDTRLAASYVGNLNVNGIHEALNEHRMP